MFSSLGTDKSIRLSKYTKGTGGWMELRNREQGRFAEARTYRLRKITQNVLAIAIPLSAVMQVSLYMPAGVWGIIQ